MKQKWNDRYSSEEYYFGKEPNDFFKEEIDKLQPGKALFIGDGEGRNSVYAAKIGWSVDSIDISDVGKNKAEKLASENKVKINYLLADALEFNYPVENYDLVAVIYFHVDENFREQIHNQFIDTLKSRGRLILSGLRKRSHKTKYKRSLLIKPTLQFRQYCRRFY